MDGWLFWTIAGLMAVASLGLALGPLWRGGGRADRRASYDMQLLRDQLREIEADRARGLLAPAEADASRAEVSRRLFAAADAEATEPAAGAAPRSASRGAAALAGGAGLVAAAALYVALAAPGLPDLPSNDRAARPDQASAEEMAAASRPAPPPSADDALIDRLKTVVASRPDDLEGHRLLARSLAASSRWPEARAAQAEVVAIRGDAATADELVELAEYGVIAAGGYVSPESEAALVRALEREPSNPVGRYYSALALLQGGRPDLARNILAGLVAQGPADAPWMTAARASLAEAESALGPRAPGPSAADVDAAAGMAPEDRQAMIEGMVRQLGDRLAAEGGPPGDWARLIRALTVLGRPEEAATIADKARTAFAGDPAARAEIDAAAAGEAGTP